MRARPRPLQLSRKNPPHGHHIYAYCNVRTNQVLYSLRESLRRGSLGQLPDIGANHTPPTLRKDSWRPLWSVQLPATPEGCQQGLDAFKRLREYRKLHELHWTPPPSLSRLYTEKEIEKFQTRLDERGGSKTENVFDLMKRAKHKMKIHEIMNQKANSIADLADVLLKQREEGDQRLARIETRIADTTLDIENTYTNTTMEDSQLLEDTIRRNKKKVQRCRNNKEQLKEDLERELNRTMFARRAVDSAKRWILLSQQERDHETEYWQKLANLDRVKLRAKNRKPLKELNRALTGAEEKLRDLKKLPETKSEKSESDVAAQTHEAAEMEREIKSLKERIEHLGQQEQHREFAISYVKRAQSFEQIAIAAHAMQLRIEPVPEIIPENRTTKAAEEEVTGESIDYKTLLPLYPVEMDKRRPFKDELRSGKHVVYTTEGVTVHWANPLDAEFAEAWPDNVKHEVIDFGYHRHRHPSVAEVERRAQLVSPLAKRRKEKKDYKRECRENYLRLSDEEKLALREESRAAKEGKKTSRQVVLQDMQRSILETIESNARTERWEKYVRWQPGRVQEEQGSKQIYV